MIKPFKPDEACKDAIRQSECFNVLRRGKILHLGLFHAKDPEDPDAVNYPYVIPIFYGFDCKDDIPVIYMHLGHWPEKPRLKSIMKNPHVYFSVESDVDVVPMMSNPCMSSVRYLGVEGRGIIEYFCYKDREEDAKYALKVMMRQMTGKMSDGKMLKWDFKPEILKWLVILKMTVTGYTNTSHAYDFQPSGWKPPDECCRLKQDD